MQKTKFSTNHNSKLLADTFTTVRLHDGKYRLYEDREIYLRDKLLGRAEVMSIIQFKMSHLPDAIAFVDCGGNAEYLKKMLQRFYKDTHQDSLFDVITLQWRSRSPQQCEDIFKNAWDKLIEKATGIIDQPVQFAQ